MDNAERCRAYRAKRKAGHVSLKSQVALLVQRVEDLDQLVEGLVARVTKLEGHPDPLAATQNNRLAQLRAQIAAVPPRRPEQVFVPKPNQMPVQPYGECEPS